MKRQRFGPRIAQQRLAIAASGVGVLAIGAIVVFGATRDTTPDNPTPEAAVTAAVQPSSSVATTSTTDSPATTTSLPREGSTTTTSPSPCHEHDGVVTCHDEDHLHPTPPKVSSTGTTVVVTIGSGGTSNTIVEHDSLVIANPDGTVTEVEPGPVVTPPPAQTPTTTTPSPAQDGYDAAVDYLMATTQWPAPPSIPGFVLLSPEMTFQRVDLEEGVDGSLNDAVFIIGRYRYQVIDGYAGFNDPLGWCAAIRDALPGLLSETACTMNDGHWSPPAAKGAFNGGLWANFYYELDPGSLSRLQFETSVLLKDVP